MPCNIEIKARVQDAGKLRGRIGELGASAPEVLNQEDTFFPCSSGRLKLRQLAEDQGELIAYLRPDLAGIKASDYLICETCRPDILKQVLASALGVTIVVRKVRYKYLLGQTRIHLDEVENLGCFLELEVVMRAGQPLSEGQQIARDLMDKLAIPDSDLLEGAYADLLRDAAPAQDKPAGTTD